MDSHIKDISDYQFTVFITEPFYLEKVVHPLPRFWRHDCRVSRNGQLTPAGQLMAKEALSALSGKAESFMSIKDDLPVFLEDYHREKERTEALVEEVNSRLRQAGWKDRPAVLKEKRDLQKKLETLYRTMFRERFGDGVVMLYEEEINSFSSLRQPSRVL